MSVEVVNGQAAYPLLGKTVVNQNMNDLPQYKFIFSDLRFKTAGTYRLSFRLLELTAISEESQTSTVIHIESEKIVVFEKDITVAAGHTGCHEQRYRHHSRHLASQRASIAVVVPCILVAIRLLFLLAIDCRGIRHSGEGTDQR